MSTPGHRELTLFAMRRCPKMSAASISPVELLVREVPDWVPLLLELDSFFFFRRFTILFAFFIIFFQRLGLGSKPLPPRTTARSRSAFLPVIGEEERARFFSCFFSFSF